MCWIGGRLRELLLRLEIWNMRPLQISAPPPSPEKKTSFCTSYDIRDVYGTFNECDLSNSTKLMFIKGLVLSFVSRLSL